MPRLGGRRTSTTLGGTTTTNLLSGGEVVQEQQGGSVTASRVPGLGVDTTASRTDGAGTRTPLTDGLGSVLALVDGTGAVQTTYAYGPFGATTTSGQASGNPSQYTGRENDGTGLYYYRARYYSPALHRFISEDPLGFGGGDTNLYAYVGNSPTNLTDPSGLWIETALDIASLAYDAQQLATSTIKEEFWMNAAFLGLDVLGLLLPGVTGLGMIGRVASKADNVDDIAELAMRSRSASGVPRTLENRLNPERYIDEVVQHYGINLRGSGQSIQALFDPSLPLGQNGVTRASEGGRVIRIGPSALADEATLANTIAHELSHARDYLRGGIHKPHGGFGSLGDGTAYGAGNALESWINGLR